MADSDFRRQSRDLISFWQIKFSGKSYGYVLENWTAVTMVQTSGLDPFSLHHFYILYVRSKKQKEEQKNNVMGGLQKKCSEIVDKV